MISVTNLKFNLLHKPAYRANGALRQKIYIYILKYQKIFTQWIEQSCVLQWN